MKHAYFSLLTAAVIFSCGESRRASDQNTSMDAITYQCYRYTDQHDTVTLQLQRVDELATGALSYNLYEKDKNQGTLQGTWSGDTLYADYVFASEGTVSMREVAFVKRGEALVEGFGETEEREGRVVISDRKALIFAGKIILEKVPCEHTHTTE